VVEHRPGLGEPAAGDVDPAGVVELEALDGPVAIDESFRRFDHRSSMPWRPGHRPTMTPSHPQEAPVDEQTIDTDTDTSDADLVEEELLVEEVSIDGMCGVY
jgi:mycofactocin precursor